MSKSKVFDTALSIIDKHIHLDHKEIARKIYAETGYCDQDFNKFLAVVSSGSLTFREYIRKRRLYFAVCELVNNPEKPLADIAQEFRYSDQSAFSRAVKKEYDKTPAEIRRDKLEIPDNRLRLENYITSDSRLNTIMGKIVSDSQLCNSDGHYFETFIHATDEFGFGVSTCCLISELAEKLSVPFGYLLEKCFDMMIDFEREAFDSEEVDYMINLGIYDGTELEEICQYYNCKYYELIPWQVQEYQKEHKSET